MKKKEKRMIAIIIIIGVLVIGGIILIKNTQNSTSATEEDTNEVKEEFVSVLEDGTKLNTSTKLSQAKTVNGLDLSDFQLTSQDSVTVLLGTITNNTSNTVEEFEAKVKIIDKEGNELDTIGLYVPELKAGESTQLNTSVPDDYANAYDFVVTKK